MRSSVNAMLSFGIVNVPVGVAPAVSDKEAKFVNLHEEDEGRMGEQKFCKSCGEIGVETVKGFEYAKGQYVKFTAEEVERVKPARSADITIRKFVKAAELKPMMVANHHFLIPNETVNVAYGILYQALLELKAVGIGTQTLWGKEHPCAVAANQDFPGHGVLLMHTLNVFEDLVEPDFTAPIPSREEKKVAKELIASYTDEFDPVEDLVSRSRDLMQELISAKVEGRELPEQEGVEAKDITLDLLNKMKADLEQRAGKKEVAKK